MRPNKICEIKKCSRKVYGNGYCVMHYKRAVRNGGNALGLRTTCKKCGSAISNGGGRRSFCSEFCQAAAKRESNLRHATSYHQRNRELCNAKRREYHLKGKFGLSVDEYNKLLLEQQGVCAICKRPCQTGRRLAVDHEHGTGRIRGLLCAQCNRGLGRFLDNPDALEQAAVYLRKFQQDALRTHGLIT